MSDLASVANTHTLVPHKRYRELLKAEAEAAGLRAALEPIEAWATHAIGVMKDRRLVSLDQIEDGDNILTIVREALNTR